MPPAKPSLKLLKEVRSSDPAVRQAAMGRVFSGFLTTIAITLGALTAVMTWLCLRSARYLYSEDGAHLEDRELVANDESSFFFFVFLACLCLSMSIATAYVSRRLRKLARLETGIG